MVWLLFLVILIFLAGIILLSGKSPLQKKTREQFLEELAKYLEGTLEPIEDEMHDNSFRIRFKFEGEDFVFEDLEKKGFKDKIYKAYLKVKTPSKLTLTFTEKKRSTKITTDIFIASEVSTQYVDEDVHLHIPDHLKDLHVFANDPAEANKLFEDKKATNVFKQFKNVDTRGYPFLSIGILEGTVILEFYSGKTFKPNLFSLQANMASIENYLDTIMVLVRKLKEES